MSMSRTAVVNMLMKQKCDLDINDLGLLLTVLRDNTTSVEVYKVLDKYVKELIDYESNTSR